MMLCRRKNKNELLVLTGAIYAFVAYLTAFVLEVLFIIDLAKRSGSLMATFSTIQQSGFLNDEDDQMQTSNGFQQTKPSLESMQNQTAISCLAISILYFVLFVASSMLIVALILRSTVFISIWMCIMTIMYLPELCLNMYVSIYGWGLETRNGQTELLFYIFRAALNVIFIFRAHRLFKDWNYEKNFFMLKANSRLNGYDSPYFIGDSLTTTINPVFSTSTLHLDCYDQVRDFGSPSMANNNHGHQLTGDDFAHRSHYSGSLFESQTRNSAQTSYDPLVDSYINETRQKHRSKGGIQKHPPIHHDNFFMSSSNRLGLRDKHQSLAQVSKMHQQLKLQRQNSLLSINDTDDYADFELDLDYRTLTNQRNLYQTDHNNNSNHNSSNNKNSNKDTNTSNHDTSDRNKASRSMVDAEPTAGSISVTPDLVTKLRHDKLGMAMGERTEGPYRSLTNVSYSTQSLDRRQLKDMEYQLGEQVTLRPLGHLPFEYLNRPGSSSNLNSISNLNTHQTTLSGSSTASSKKLLPKRQSDLFTLSDYRHIT